MQNDESKIQYSAQNSFSLSEMNKVFNEWVKKLLPTVQGLKKSKLESQELASNDPAVTNSDAVFFAWQETPTGDRFALYNVISKQHPLYGSTVSEVTLRRQNLKVPPTPFPQKQLKRLDFEKRE